MEKVGGSSPSWPTMMKLRRFFGFSDGVRRSDGFWRYNWETIQKGWIVPAGDEPGSRLATQEEMWASEDGR